MLTQTFGRLRQEAGEHCGVHFERVYDYTVDELWSALTDPAQLRGWLGTTELDLRVGGEVVVRFAEDETVRGVVRQLEPKRLLEYTWNIHDEPQSILRIELEPRDRGTLLVLDHRMLAVAQATGYGAGWHAHLDGLEHRLGGREHDWDARFAELLPAYRKQAAELPEAAG